DAAARRTKNLALDIAAVLAREGERDGALAGKDEVGRAVLVRIGVAADDDRSGPARHQARHVPADDRLAKDGAAEGGPDWAVGRRVYRPEIELLHARFVRRDGRAFHTDSDLLDHLGGVDRDLVTGLVAVLHPEVVVEQLDVEVGMDQLVLDELPDDPGHLVP